RAARSRPSLTFGTAIKSCRSVMTRRLDSPSSCPQLTLVAGPGIGGGGRPVTLSTMFRAPLSGALLLLAGLLLFAVGQASAKPRLAITSPGKWAKVRGRVEG